MKQQNGFTIIELMVSIAILGLLTALAVPSFSEWRINSRIDNEISALHRTILTTRNTAINIEQPVTMCPLDDNTCTNDWTQEITVFIDLNNNGQLEKAVAIDLDNDGIDESVDEKVIRVKNAVKNSSDLLIFNRDRIVYSPTGQASASQGTFTYCVPGHSEKRRGIVLSLRGRAYATQDYNNDGIDERRTGEALDCP